MFGPQVNALHIPRGKVSENGEGVYLTHQNIDQPNNDIGKLSNPLVVDKNHVYTVEIPASCFEDNARFIKDIKLQHKSSSSSSSSMGSPTSETENFFLMFQLMSQVCYYAMKFSNSAKYNSGNSEEAVGDEAATAQQYIGGGEEDNQVFAFIEGIPNVIDSKRDAMVRLWILPQKHASFTCDFPTLLAKVIGGEEMEKKKKSGFRHQKVAYEAFADNYKRLIGNHDKYLNALYQTRYGRADRHEMKKSIIRNGKAREQGQNTRGLGSPYNAHNIIHHFSVFPTDNNVDDEHQSYWEKMYSDDGYQGPGDDYKLSLPTLWPNVDKKYFNMDNYFQLHEGKLVFCPLFRKYMFHFLPSELGVHQCLVRSKSKASAKARSMNRGPCSYLLPVRYVETMLIPKKAEILLQEEMNKLCIQQRNDEPYVSNQLNMDRMGRYTVGTPSFNFALPEGTTVHNHHNNLLTFGLEEGLSAMLLRAAVGVKLAKYAQTRTLIENNTSLDPIQKLKQLRENYWRTTSDNLKVFLQEINGKASMSPPLTAICQHIEREVPEVSPFAFQRLPASNAHNFIATLIQSDLFEYEYYFCVAHNHKELFLMVIIGWGATRLDMMPIVLILLGVGQGGKSWLEDMLQSMKIVGSTRNCNTSSNMAHTIGHSINCLKLFHEMQVMDTHGGKDPASKQRVATMKAIAAAGYFQHERVYKDDFDGQFKKTTALLVSCCPAIKATNDINWANGDDATMSRNQVKKIKRIQLRAEKNVHTKEDANHGKFYQQEKQLALHKKQLMDAVINHFQWMLNDTGVLDDITQFVFPYVQKHIMKTADKTITNKVDSRNITRVSVYNQSLVKAEAFEILFSYLPPFKTFHFTIEDTRVNREATYTLDETNENHKDIVKDILNSSTQQTRWTAPGGTTYILDKKGILGARIFILKEENLDANTETVVGRWSFTTKYKTNPYGLTDDVPPSHIPLVGKYFGIPYNWCLESKLQQTFRDDLDSLLYDTTASVIGAFSFGESNFYSSMSTAILDAFVELSLHKLCKTQQKYLEEDEKKNYMYIHIGNTNGTQLYENIKDIVSKKSIETHGKKIDVSDIDFNASVKELQKATSTKKKWRKAVRVRKIRDETTNTVSFQWPTMENCLRQETVTISNTNQQTLQSSMPLSEEEIHETAKYNIVKKVKTKGTTDSDIYFLVPYCREWATRDMDCDNTTIVGTLKSFTHKYAKPKVIATGNGTMEGKHMYPEIGELIELKPNNKEIVNKQPNVITPAAAKVLGCDPKHAEQNISSIKHDLDDLSCLSRQSQLYKTLPLSTMNKTQIDEALELATVKARNKTHLMELVHASNLDKDPDIYPIGDDASHWQKYAVKQALDSFASNSDNISNVVQENNNNNTSAIHIEDDDLEVEDDIEEKRNEADANRPSIRLALNNTTESGNDFTLADMEDVRRAYERVNQDESHNTNNMMMMPTTTEDEANEEDTTIHINQLGVDQIGKDPEEVTSSLIDNEAGTERANKRQKTNNHQMFGSDDDDDY